MENNGNYNVLLRGKLSVFTCERCGWCCRNIVINIAYSDIVRWFHDGRLDVLQEVAFINNYPRKGTGGFYFAKTTFNPKQLCPFLKDNSCQIYDARPVSCRDFPLGCSAECGCPAWKADKQLYAEVVKRQFKDFRMAHDNRGQLLQILVEVRRAS